MMDHTQTTTASGSLPTYMSYPYSNPFLAQPPPSAGHHIMMQMKFSRQSKKSYQNNHNHNHSYGAPSYPYPYPSATVNVGGAPISPFVVADYGMVAENGAGVPPNIMADISNTAINNANIHQQQQSMSSASASSSSSSGSGNNQNVHSQQQQQFTNTVYYPYHQPPPPHYLHSHANGTSHYGNGNGNNNNGNSNSYNNKKMHRKRSVSDSATVKMTPKRESATTASSSVARDNQPAFYKDIDREMPILMKQYLAFVDSDADDNPPVQNPKHMVFPVFKDYLKDFNIHLDEKKKISDNQKTRWQEMAEKLFTIILELQDTFHPIKHRARLLQLQQKAKQSNEKEIDMIINNYLCTVS
ncbi:hypothetical protein DFA_03463 [Cavenderia fasciculata]|uniref:Uncharacterized protein n=1 Tax=Cavenderia fasciculata TaxID=261658 RepID=F4PHN1_CACFS|nr:uncharacterized protein DFA_03463 [Cavenderia fasciculata]EGG25215.1 hypothetical protein DFA_03463 [Cavenderia fasciculata]|eukprot:XP_004363066.1 hypothetical protein DFA_03463 [Cavenderia fasciculata]